MLISLTVFFFAKVKNGYFGSISHFPTTSAKILKRDSKALHIFLQNLFSHLLSKFQQHQTRGKLLRAFQAGTHGRCWHCSLQAHENNQKGVVSVTAHKLLKEFTEIRDKLGKEHLQNHKLQCYSVPDNFMADIYSFHIEC